MENQDSKPQILDIETLEVQVLEIRISNIQVSKVQVLDIHVLEVHILVFKEANVVHVLEDRVTNMNETMKAP